MPPLQYSNGVEAKIGDHVDYDGEPSVVEDVIDTPKKMASWGLEGAGLM